MKSINRLSARLITTLVEPKLHADGNGLYLLIDKAGCKRWVFIFQWKKRRAEMSLGPLVKTTLAEARVKAEACRKMVSDGINPITVRKRKVGKGYTFGEAADDLIASLKGGWHGRVTEASWKNALENHAKPLRGKSVQDITTEDIVDVLKPLWTTKAETAQKLRSRIERALDGAKAHGHIESPWENPARWKGHLAMMLAKPHKLSRGHHAALPYKQLPAFMEKLAQREGFAARALEYTIRDPAGPHAARVPA